MKDSCTEIIQHSGFIFRLLRTRNLKVGFLFTTFLNSWKNSREGKLNDMFVIWQNKYNCKCTHDYAQRCQVLSKQVNCQYFSDCKSISIKGVALGKFKNWNHQP